jgi:hypothetical protein
VLGHIWRPELDHIIFKLEVNIHEKVRVILSNLTKETLHTLDTETFTRRKVLSIISSFYNPMGLISAYLVIFKIVILGRVIDNNIPRMPENPCSVTMIGDSQSTISALESVTAVLGPYFANCILELEGPLWTSCSMNTMLSRWTPSTTPRGT